MANYDLGTIGFTVENTGAEKATTDVVRLVKEIDRLEKQYAILDRAFNKNKLTAQDYAKGVQQVDKAIESIKNGQNSLIATQQKLVASTNQVTSAIQKQAYIAQESQKANRRFEVGIQQAGYQVGDFFTQVASGTNPMVAFTQQATQLAGFFAGPWGAIIGAGLSVFGAVAIAMGVASDKTTKLSFDFSKFGQDMKVAIEPLMPILKVFWEAIKFLGKVALESINGILNGFRYLGAAVGAIPDAFDSVVTLVDAHMFKLEVTVRGYIETIKAAIQDMFDMMSGTTAMTRRSNGTPISVADSYREVSTYWQQVAIAEGQRIANMPGPGDVIGEAVSKVNPIDISNYFSSSKVPGKGGAGKGPSDDVIKNRLEEIYKYLETTKYLVEQENIAYEQRQDTLEMALQKKLLTQQEYNQLELDLATKHAKDVADIENKAKVQKLSTVLGSGAQILEAIGQHNEKAAKMARVFGAAQALADTYAGAAAALKLPFPANLAAASSIIAAGLGFVSAIKSGSTSARPSSGSVARGSATVANSAPAQAPQTVYIDSIKPESLYSGETLIKLFDSFYDENDKRGKVFMVAR